MKDYPINVIDCKYIEWEFSDMPGFSSQNQ